MSELFHFIYIQSPLLLIALACGGLILWRWVRDPLWDRLDRPGLWHGAALILFVLWAAAVLYVTLLDRSEGEGEILLTPFWSYREAFAPGGSRELLRANLMNVLLFLPGGLLLGELAPRHWHRQTALLALGLSLVFSGCVESLQGLFGLGIAETDDVIHNTLGGLLGSLPAALPRRRPAKRQRN